MRYDSRRFNGVRAPNDGDLASLEANVSNSSCDIDGGANYSNSCNSAGAWRSSKAGSGGDGGAFNGRPDNRGGSTDSSNKATAESKAELAAGSEADMAHELRPGTGGCTSNREQAFSNCEGGGVVACSNCCSASGSRVSNMTAILKAEQQAAVGEDTGSTHLP